MKIILFISIFFIVRKLTIQKLSKKVLKELKQTKNKLTRY